MAVNPYKKIPTDRAGSPMQEFTGNKALAQHGATVAVSSVITLTDDTTTLEVGAVGGGGVVIRWVPVTETAAVAPAGSVIAAGANANFDHYIPPNWVGKFAVPIETFVAQASVVGLNKQNGLYNRVAWIAATTSASVFGAQY